MLKSNLYRHVRNFHPEENNKRKQSTNDYPCAAKIARIEDHSRVPHNRMIQYSQTFQYKPLYHKLLRHKFLRHKILHRKLLHHNHQCKFINHRCKPLNHQCKPLCHKLLYHKLHRHKLLRQKILRNDQSYPRHVRSVENNLRW